MGRGGTGILVPRFEIGLGMQVQFNPSGFRGTSWFEYVLRFFFGGLITVAAGLIGKKYGPGIGGLLLAFPAIFPAAATLIEKREKNRKHRLGLHGTKRGREAASLEATGAARGSVALLGFALGAWWLMPRHNAVMALGLSTLAWVVVAGIVWGTRHAGRRLRRKFNSGA